jgi:predicted acetyltransferase
VSCSGDSVSEVEFIVSEGTEMEPSGTFNVREVGSEQWKIVAWLWQAYRHDLATIVGALPYEDGRYQAALLSEFPRPDSAAYMAWRPHPKSGDDAPIGFVIVSGLTQQRRTVDGFWVAPVARRSGVGRAFATNVLARYPAPWTIAFQHDNVAAGIFWRDVANSLFGVGRWSEERRPVPGLPAAPPDHFIESS